MIKGRREKKREKEMSIQIYKLDGKFGKIRGDVECTVCLEEESVLLFQEDTEEAVMRSLEESNWTFMDGVIYCPKCSE